MNIDKHGFKIGFLSVFICVYLWFFCFSAHADWQAKTVSSLQKLTATAPGVLENFSAEPANLRAVRGEWESFQIVVHADEKRLESVEPILSDLTSQNQKFPSENIHVFYENYVYVPHPSGNRRLEKLWWPDALIPDEDQNDTSIEPNRTRVLWVNLRVPENAAAGDYSGQIQIRANKEIKSLPIKLQVENFALPAPTLRANVAVYYDVLRDWYTKNARPLSDNEFSQLKKNYYDFLLDYRINAYDLPVDWNSDAAQKYLRDPRVLSVRTPPLDRADFNEALAAFKKANALKKAYYYWIDEPSPEQYEGIKSATRKLRKFGIKHCVTAHPNQSLQGAVDIWCPNIGDFFGLKTLDLTSLTIERAKGHENWLYTMAWPRYPYPTWLLDDDSTAVRNYGWLWAQNNINGFVYSMAHGWGPKPLENLQSFGETNGDGTLLYPAAALNKDDLRPLPSIRLMLLRDAIEDYELTMQLPGNWRDLNLMHGPDIILPQNLPYVEPLNLFDLLNYRRVTSADIQNRKSLLLLFLKASENNTNNLVTQSLSMYSNFYEEKISPAPMPLIDGQLNDKTWTVKTQQPGKLYRQPEETPPVSTQVWLAHKDKNLFVAARCPLMPRSSTTETKGEWFAVDLAPHFATMRWRFIVTPSGKGIVEKHSREGHFRIDGVKWKFAARASRDFYNIEMQIPLDEIELKNQFRFNARRRFHDTQLDIHYLLNAFADSEDVSLMPRVDLK